MSINSLETLGSVNSHNDLNENDIVEIHEWHKVLSIHPNLFEDIPGFIRLETLATIFRGRAKLLEGNKSSSWVITDLHTLDEDGQSANFCMDMPIEVYESSMVVRTVRKIQPAGNEYMTLDLDLSDTNKI